MIEINDKNFNEIIQKPNQLIIVDFWAEWCAPCRILTPILQDVSTNFNNVIFAKCNVDENPIVTSKFGIRSIPTILYFKNGNVIDTQIGVAHKDNFINKINILSQ